MIRLIAKLEPKTRIVSFSADWPTKKPIHSIASITFAPAERTFVITTHTSHGDANEEHKVHNKVASIRIEPIKIHSMNHVFSQRIHDRPTSTVVEHTQFLNTVFPGKTFPHVYKNFTTGTIVSRDRRWFKLCVIKEIKQSLHAPSAPWNAIQHLSGMHPGQARY